MKTKISLLSFLVTASALMVTPLANAATYYWDNNGTGANYGTAGGTWAAPTVGSATQGWTTATNGTTAPTGSITTLSTNATTDAVNFGNGASGLAAGTITVGTVAAGNMTFASGSGAIVLSSGTITLSATQTTTVNNATNTINSILAGAGTSLTKAGTGTLVLTGANTYTGSTIINAGTLVLTGANSYTGSTIINAGTINLGGGTADGSLSSTTLTLGGGSFSYTRTGSTTQGFTTTNINGGGATQISVVSGNTLNLGTVARGVGAALDFSSLGAGVVSADTASHDFTGIMAGLNFGNSWAVANGAGVAVSGLAGASYALTSVATTNETAYLDANVDVDDNSGSPAAAITANSLRFSEAEANTLTLATGPNTITTGGILVGSGVGANLSTITGGTLTGIANRDLSIIQNNTSGGLTISSSIVNTTSTSVTKSGAGLLTLGANNTFTGGVVINAGILALGNAGALNSTAANAVAFGASSTGTLVLAGNSVVVSNLSTNATPGTTFVQNANGSAVSNATLTVGNSANLSGTFAGIIQDGTGGGTLALTKAGTGTLTLSGANTYSGGTSLTAGTVTISNATSFGSGAVTVTGTTSRINVTTGITYANDIAVNGPLTMQNPVTATSTATFTGILSGASSISLPNTSTNGQQGILAFTNTANTFTGSIVLSGGGAGDEHFLFNSIGDGGNFTFAKNGNRQLITHTGSSDITFATRTINIASSMTNMTTRQGMDGGGGNPVSSFFSSGTGALTFNANMGMTSLASDGAFYFNGTNTGNNTFAGTIGEPTSAGRLWIGKLGAGTWLLTGDNTFEGGAIIAGGILSVSKIENAANAQPLGKGPIIQFGVGNNGASGSLVFTGTTNSTTDKQVVIGAINQGNSGAAGSMINNGSGTLTFSNSAFNPTITGNVVAGITTNAVTVARTLTIGGSNTGANTISGIIQNNNGASGTVALTKAGVGTWVLSGSNSYTGLTTISGGVLRITNNTALGTTAGGVTVASGSGLEIDGTSGVVTVGAEAISIAGGGVSLPTPNLGAIRNIAGDNTYGGTVTLTAQSRINSDSGTLLFNNATAVTGATRNLVVGGAGNITISGAITTTTGFVSKDGAGTLTLSGANTYTGDTSVNQGTLALGANNVIADTSPVSIGAASLSVSTFTDTVGTLDPTAAAVINLGSGGALAFANSAAVDWTGGTLNITGTFVSGSSIRFGTTSSGLTSGQLAVITVNGTGAGSYGLDADGYLISAGDATPPTLTSITDNVSGGPVNIGATVTYTVTFSEDMDDTTVTTADFGNNGTAVATIDSVTETTPGVFSVVVTPTSPGTLVLRINALAVLEDVAGNDLDTDPALLDDTTITVRNAYQTWALTNAISSAPGADKDGDGVNNAIEFLLGGDFATNDLSKLPEVTMTATEMIITFERKRSSIDGITGCTIEVGTTLTGWPTTYTVGSNTAGSTAGVVVTENSPAGFDTITLTVPIGSDPKKFARLNANVTE
jgi:autotransporter-associated beta strand protein